EKYQGTGIGLSICQKIVEYHKGQIRIDTEYTKGLKLDFDLPQALVN
ncbi:MAG: ATP-binding protein, partial [Bacteroidota bacterium]